MNGRISASALSGDKDSVVQKTYTFTPTEMIVRDATALASVELYEGSYGVGSNGVDVPQYEPLTPTGNSFIKVPADQAGNPVSVDMMGVGLVDANTFSSIAMTKSGSLAIYAKNQTTAWTRILTSNLGDSKYVALTGDQSIDGTKTFIKGIYVDSLTSSNGISGKSLTVTESITGESITVDNSTLGTAQADNLKLGQPLSVANGGTGSKNATGARSALGVKAAGTFDIVPIANGGTNASTALQARINLGLISKTESDTLYLKTASNLSDLSDVEEARTNLDVLSTIENDAKYLQAVNNLNDIDDTAIARTNLGVQSTSEIDAKYVPRTTTINDHELTGNITLSSFDTGSLAIINNLSDVSDPAIARTNLGVQSTSESDSKYLIKDDNLSDISDIAIARTNLNVNRILQDTSYTSMFSSDMKSQLSVRDDGLWGMFVSGNGANAGWKPLLLAQGGTGAKDVVGAKNNLQVDRLVQHDKQTWLHAPDKDSYLYILDSGEWGCYSLSSGNKPLGVTQGGTGGNNQESARQGLGIATSDVVWFKGVVTQSVTGVGGAWTPVVRKLKDQQTADVNRNNQLSYLENSDCAVTNYIITVNGVAQYVWQMTRSDNITNWFSMRADNTMHTPLGQVSIQGSDVRIKENFEPVQKGAWDRISKIGICEYTYKSNSVPQRGYLAQQMEAIDPLYVFEGGTSTDDDGNEFEILNVNDKAVQADMITVVQELQTQVKEQKSQITQLMAMVHAQNLTITELMNK